MSAGDQAEMGAAVAPAVASWKKASAVVKLVQASQGFKTLRDMLPDDRIIDANQIKVKSQLGEGAFAFVNLGELENGCLVAVKTLKPELLENPEDVKLFLKETELMRKIRNPAIVDLIGVGGKIDPTGGENFLDLYIVQEFCAGGSLRDLVYKQMTTNKKFMYSQADALRWCISIAKALHYLHTANPKVIHRDLKLDNVLLTDRDVSLATAKLADFGLAKLLARSHKGQQKQLSLQKLVSKSEKELLPLDRARSVSVKKVMLSLDSMSWTTTTAATASTTTTTTATTLPLPPSAFSSESIKLPEKGKEHPPTAAGGNISATSSSGSGKLHDMTGEAGSYSYMAPEVLRGEQYNEKADLFSFAMLMYNLFYRVIPSVLLFANGGQSEDMSMLAWETANGYRPKLSTTGMIPDSIHAVITECWHGVPEMRPSAKEVLEKLMKIQESGVCKGSGDKSKTTTSNGKESGATGCACTLM